MLEMVSLAMNEVFYYVQNLVIWMNQTQWSRIFFVISISISLVFVTIKIIKSTVWGR